MNKLYDRIDFHNGSAPAINETNLNAMSKAIDDIDSRVADLYISQVDVEEVKADTALTKKYRDEAYSTTPQGYADLVTDVSQLKSEVSNPNLLDNPFFQVNQRGQSSYSGSGYCVDRWRSWATGANTINSDKSISIDRQIGQFINDVDGIKGKTLTLSVMYSNGTIYSASANIPTTLTAKRLIDYRITSNVGICLYSDGQGHVSAQFNNESGTAIAIKAVKLEYGSISTLANDHAPNYADELLRCQGSTADDSDTYANITNGFIWKECASALTTTNSTVYIPTKWNEVCIVLYDSVNLESRNSGVYPKSFFAYGDANVRSYTTELAFARIRKVNDNTLSLVGISGSYVDKVIVYYR